MSTDFFLFPLHPQCFQIQVDLRSKSDASGKGKGQMPWESLETETFVALPHMG